MALKTKTLEAVFQEGTSLVDFLPYFDFWEGVFVQTDGSLGKVWEIQSVDSELKETSFLENLSHHLEGLVMRLPAEGLSCQFILTSDSFMEGRLEEYLHYQEEQNPSELSRFLKTERMDHIQKSKEGFFSHNQGVFCPKRIRILFTLRYFPQWDSLSWLGKIRCLVINPEFVKDRFQDGLVKHKKTLDQMIPVIEGIFNSVGFKAQSLTDAQLVQFLYVFLNPKRSKTIPTVNVNVRESLRDQMLYHAPYVDDKGFDLEGICTRVVSLKELPEKTFPGMFSADSYEGSRFCFLDLIQNAMVVMNFTVPQISEAVGRLKFQKGFAFLHRTNFLGDSAIEAQEKKKELDETLVDLFRAGRKIVHSRVHFIVMGKDEEEAEKASDHLLTLLNRLHCEGLKEDMIGASLFLTCLPLNFDSRYEQFIRRNRRMVSDNFSDMVPLYGSFQGTKTPAQMYFNRRGEIVFLDFFDSPINPHGVVIGASGSGKSFFINDFILHNERLGAHFFVLDKGDSYKKLCSILGGQYVVFDLNNPLTINPFYQEPTPENLAFLISMLSQMASGGDDRDRLSREEEGLLQKAILKAYENRKSDKEITLTDIVDLLKDKAFNQEYGLGDQMGAKLALQLTPFTRKGPYGKFFDGPNKFDFQSRFTVFELGNLSSHEDLQLVVLLNIMFFITLFVSSPLMKPKRKFLLIDEAWSLLKLKNTAQFITGAFKTFRKYRCSAVAVTQELSDLTQAESGLAILSNASNKIFLKQDSSVLDLLKLSLSLKSGTIDALKTLETVKSKFSEALVLTDTASGIIRLVPNPYLYWIANTETKDNAFLENMVQTHNNNFLEALSACVKEFPYGIR